MIIGIVDDFLRDISSYGLGCVVTEVTLSPIAFHSLVTDIRIRFLDCKVDIDDDGCFYVMYRGVKVKCLTYGSATEAGLKE